MNKWFYMGTLALLTASCGSDEQIAMILPQTRSVELTADQRQMVEQCNTFAFSLSRSISQDSQYSNGFLLSPLSTAYVMGMLWQGAQGKTAGEIAAVMGMPDNQVAGGLFGTLMDDLPEVDPSVTLKTANLLAADKVLFIDDSYRNAVEHRYHAHVASLDLSLPSSLDYLNGWCSKQTEGAVPTIVDKLDPDSRLVLINATYFKATWTEKFDKAETHDEAFISEKATSMLPMMHRKALLLYGSNDLFRMIDLPYGSGDKWSMKVLLPQEGKSVDEILAILTVDSWKHSQRQLSPAVVDVKLPRFTAQSSLKLNDIVRQLGAPTMFSPQDADFSTMCSNAPLYVSTLLQKSALELTEEGTQMSAVSVAEFPAGSAGPVTEERVFHATHPFVYVVQEASSGIVLLVGVFRG